MLTPGSWSAFSVEEAEPPRLDVYLAKKFPELSRTAAQRLIDEGNVKINGVAAKASLKPEPGDEISIFLPLPKPPSLAPEAIPLTILYQDDHLAVIEKPAGLVVHPAAGHSDGTLVNALLHHLGDLSSGGGVGGELRPGIVHRIDRNTSGILLVTKTDRAHQELATQFKEHTITRRYRGLCWGKLPASGEWDKPIARDPKERKRMAIVEGGRRAVTRFRSLKHFGSGVTELEAELLTGRTHQVRIHCAAHGFPLCGDSVYIEAGRSGRMARKSGVDVLRRHCPEALAGIETLEANSRQFLHAAFLAFTHPATGQKMEFQSELPEDLAKIMLAFRSCFP
ncbi:MAG TPA: RluA family pseudouridine synthase [Bdellovibrionota bacterium]|jgi:23S rRNA pseudouridine1911/1915/1917 synthase